MTIEIREVTDKKQWNDYICANFQFYSFLQSWQWGEFNSLQGAKIWRVGVFESGSQIGAMQILKRDAKRGTYLFCPHGPLLQGDYFAVLGKVKPWLQDLAKKEGACFVRFDAPCENTVTNKNHFAALGWRNAPMHEHATTTWILDLRPDEEQLEAELRKTTRYLVRRARKEGVEIKQSNTQEEIELFYKLHWQHAHREKGHRYSAFTKQYVENLFRAFDSNEIKMRSAWYEGTCEASLATIRFGDFCVYYLGASDILHPKFSPSYLLQWEAILDAKKSGCQFYNFWGVAPNDDKKHPIWGVSQFKKGFGGFEYQLLHTQDLVIDRGKYLLNWVVETIRRKKRGYFYPAPSAEESKKFDKEKNIV